VTALSVNHARCDCLFVQEGDFVAEMKVFPNPLPTIVTHRQRYTPKRSSEIPKSRTIPSIPNKWQIPHMVSLSQDIIQLLAQCKERYQDGSDLAPQIEHVIEELRGDAENIKSALKSKEKRTTATSLEELHDCVIALRDAGTEEKAARTLKITQTVLETASNSWKIEAKK